MRKKIISILCSLIMIIASAEPIFADEYTDFLYNEFKNVPLTELKSTFDSNFDAFDINTDAYNFSKGYNTAQKSIIILEAYSKGFNSFEELDQNVTEAAQKLIAKTENPTLLGLAGYSNVNLSFTAPAETDPANVFKVDDKEFIVLDCVESDGEKMFFVITKDYYSYVAVDPDNLGGWDDSNSRLLPYKLTNQMAFGNYANGNLPENILKHLDYLHEWNIEPGSAAGYTNENTYVAPISVISATEFKEYGEKIGMDKTSGVFWTRTPVLGDVACRFTVNIASPKTMNKNKTWGSTVTYLRPVFYLKSSFFKEVKMQSCGANITTYLDNILSRNELDSVYSANEQKEVFGALSVTPSEVNGDAIVGSTLTTDYTYSGNIDLLDVEIVWEKSTDKVNWISANGTNSKSYVVKDEDAGYFIRAAFKSTFDSVILGVGETTYAVKVDRVYTDASIMEAIADINAAADSTTLRNLLQQHESLLHLDYSAGVFNESAATIFMNDDANSIDGVIKQYHQSIALDEFNNASDSNIKAKAESEYLLGSIDAYSEITVTEQQDSIISNLNALTTEKNKVSDFIKKAEEFIMLERINNAERGDIVELIKEYAQTLGVDISGLTTYQLEIAGTYVVGTDYRTNVDKLKSALVEGVNNARDIKTPQKPVEEETEKYPNGGFIPPVTEKPEASGNVVANSFSDLERVPWGVTAINSLAEKGILSGDGDGTFSPDRLVTRNEFVKMMVVAFGIELTDGELSYEDVDNNSWSAKYIKAAVDAGIINGIDETHFGDGKNITREDVAVIAERLMQYKGLGMKSSSLNFIDSNEISDYAVLAVAKMNYCGIMNGMDGNMFAPKNGTTRAQAAVVVFNLLNYYENSLQSEESADAEIVTRSGNDKYDLVFNLGIIKDEFATDAKITRGELAAIMVEFGKYDLFNYEAQFDDVNSGHKYSKEIESVYRNNIMAPITPKMFMPEQVATYGEAYEALIAASGYKEFAGGRVEAENALRKEPVNAHNSDELTPDMLKRMIFAALEIPVLDIVDTKTSEISKKTILNNNFDTYKAKGIVNAVAGMSIGGREELDDDKIIITVDSKDYLYSADDGDYSDYLGYRVTYYYREIDDTYQVVSMTAADSGNAPLTLSFEEISDAEKDLSAITYELDNKTKYAKIAKNADFIYNGRRCYSISKADLTPDNGYITLIDSNGDDVYDVVRIDSYEYIMIAQVDIAGRSILDRFTWETYGFVEGIDAEKVNITKNGRYIKMDYLSQGDVLSVARSRDGELVNIYVSDKKVSGSIRAISPGDCEIKIDNSTLKTVKNFDFTGLSTGMSLTVGIDWDGYAVGYYAEMLNPDLVYGYMYKVSPDEEDLDTRIVHILTQNNEHIKLRTSEKLIRNDDRVQQTVLDVMDPQLIAYTVDSQGKLKRFYSSETELGIDGSQTEPLVLNRKYVGNAPGAVYNNFGMTLDFEFNLPKNAILFDITYNNGKFDKENSVVTNVGSQAIPQQSTTENLYVYNADASRVSKLLVHEHSPKGGNEGFNESFNTQAFVISEVVEEYDEELTSVVTVYKGYHAGNQVSYKFSEKLLAEVDPSNIKAGDVLLVWLSGSQITRFRRLFALKEEYAYDGESDLLCNYGDHNYTGNSITRGGTNWDYPYDWALHIIERAEGRSGSTLISATRWGSLYGIVELVYKSEHYNNPVVSFKVAGKTTAEGYTLDSNTKIYSYSKKNKTVKLIDNSNLNFAKKKAVMTGRYGNIRDVIIYED